MPLVYTNNTQKISSVFLSDVSLSDHCPTVCSWSCKPVKIQKTDHTTVEFRSFKHFRSDLFLHDLSQINFSNVYGCSDPDQALTVWYDSLVPVVNRHAPIRRKRVKSKTLPGWLSADIMEAMKVRDSLKKDNDLLLLVCHY